MTTKKFRQIVARRQSLYQLHWQHFKDNWDENVADYVIAGLEHNQLELDLPVAEFLTRCICILGMQQGLGKMEAELLRREAEGIEDDGIEISKGLMNENKDNI